MDIKIKQINADGKFLVTKAFGVDAITGRAKGGPHEEYTVLDSPRLGKITIPPGGRVEIAAL